MKVIRTFVAVLISENLKKEISEVQEQVKKLAPDVKWVTPENFHVTLKFLGDVREDHISQVCDAVDNAARAFSPLDVSVGGLGAFPNVQRGRVVWVGIEDGGRELSDLAGALDEKLAALGFERETKPFMSHITIGRVKDRFPSALAAGMQDVNAEGLGVQRVASVAVMRSDLQPQGPVYSPLHEAKLGEGD